MTDPSYAVDLAARLIRCNSVTPADGGALTLLANELGPLGFDCISLPFGVGSDRIENLFARRGKGGPHFAFAGHTDVVAAVRQFVLSNPAGSISLIITGDEEGDAEYGTKKMVE